MSSSKQAHLGLESLAAQSPSPARRHVAFGSKTDSAEAIRPVDCGWGSWSKISPAMAELSTACCAMSSMDRFWRLFAYDAKRLRSRKKL